MRCKIFFSILYLFFFFIILMTYSCKEENEEDTTNLKPERSLEQKEENTIKLVLQPQNINTPEGMVWIEGKRFMQGAVEGDDYAMSREKPAREVAVNGFFIDKTEVTNAQFKQFVEETGYITVAERPIDWEEMKKNVPEGTPKPADSVLQPGSLIFNKNVKQVNGMGNYNQWWTWKVGANWRQPEGPGSSIDGKDNYPVVHIAYEDATAYCNWVGRSLPTESQWEAAARSGEVSSIYTWGNDYEKLSENANTWEGQFPIDNTGEDGFEFLAPVKSFPPNANGIYDMAGNVWEWTQDLYNENLYSSWNSDQIPVDPVNDEIYLNPQNPYQKERVIKGGSFLCHRSYCSSYRISARMSSTTDSGSDHVGFRTVATVEDLAK